jgi:fido (protein-threonine AMPylation protein)
LNGTTDLVGTRCPAAIRAPLVHFYYEQIHPFWDGNGRVGRVIEATLLQAAGYRYAPFAMARHYLDKHRRPTSRCSTPAAKPPRSTSLRPTSPSSTSISKACA